MGWFIVASHGTSILYLPKSQPFFLPTLLLNRPTQVLSANLKILLLLYLTSYPFLMVYLSLFARKIAAAKEIKCGATIQTWVRGKEKLLLGSDR